LNPREEKEVGKIIKKIVLLNAIRYGGKASQEAVFGKLLGGYPQYRQKIKDITFIIKETVKEINDVPLSKQIKIVKNKWPEVFIEEKTVDKKRLPSLLNVEKYRRIVTRFSPNPDFVLHLGSARAIILSYDYAKMYNGLFYLRFEDTDSKTKKPKLEFYDAIREDLKWLNCKWDAEFIQSDRLLIYYDHAEKILKNGNGYVCTCEREDFQKKIKINQSCKCRELMIEENIIRWNSMLNGTYSEGEAVVRIKTDMNHPNPAVRDWPALRIIDSEKYPHPRVGRKYRVWPLYNFSTGIDDHLMGITHIIRGKEHLTNKTRQEYMYHHFGWKYPETIHYGRLKITGASLSKSEIVMGLNKGLFKHWDDPRLATLAALRKRGITPEAIHNMIIDVGPKPVDVVLSWKNLYALNRKIIDATSKRYFFVPNPIEVCIDNIPNNFTAKIPLHPDHPKIGFRIFKIKPVKGAVKLLVSKDDRRLIKKNQMVRFMDLFNSQINKVEQIRIHATYQSDSYKEAKNLGAPLIHWIPYNSGVKCEVVMPDASVTKGIAEEACKELEPNEIIQFQRFGFVRVDHINKKIIAYFAH
jgi:glutamyl-tRNA synthetase